LREDPDLVKDADAAFVVAGGRLVVETGGALEGTDDAGRGSAPSARVTAFDAAPRARPGCRAHARINRVTASARDMTGIPLQGHS
jgi:hypothetical protein